MSAATGPGPAPRRVWPLVAAGVLVIVVVALVVVFGVGRPPALGAVVDEPGGAAAGRVAWTDDTSGSGDRCLRVADPSGEVRSLRCGDSLAEGSAIAWSDGRIVVEDDSAAVEHLVDPVTGDSETRTAPADGRGDAWDADDGSDLRTERTDGVLSVIVDGRTVWSTPAVESYDVRRAAISRDRETVLLRDAADRLLVVAADGGTPPLVWATDVPTWGPIAWEDAATG